MVVCSNPTCTIYFESRSEYSKFSNIELRYYTSHQILLVMKSRRIRWEGNVADTKATRNAYRIRQKPEGKRLLWDRWKSRKINLTGIGHRGVDSAISGWYQWCSCEHYDQT
jgi:hypothetical protein